VRTTGLLYTPSVERLDQSAHAIFIESPRDDSSFAIGSVDGVCLVVGSASEAHGTVSVIVNVVEGTGANRLAALAGARLEFSSMSRFGPRIPLSCTATFADGATARLRLPGVDRVDYV